MTDISKFQEKFIKLTEKERIEALRLLNAKHHILLSQDSKVTIKARECPHCQSIKFIKNGIQKGVQRFRCKECHINFTSFTGTLIHGIRNLGKFEEYKRKMLSDEYYSIEKMMKMIGISKQTAFDWRHKILSNLQQDTTEKFHGITEIDDIWFTYSQKGRKGLDSSRKRGGCEKKGDNDFQTKLLMTSDRNGQNDFSVVRIGRLHSSDIYRKVGDKFASDCTLVSDKHKSIKAFAKNADIKHVSFMAKKHTVDKKHHVQRINNYAERFGDIVNRQLKGVSTKYLQCYANWFGFIEKHKKSDNIIEEVNKTIFHNRTWDVFSNIETMYKGFIERYSKRTYEHPVIRKWKANNWNSSIKADMSYI